MSMSRSKSSILALAPIFIGMCAAFPAQASTPIDLTRPLDPRGRVEIDNLKGRVEVRAWDRSVVKIIGSLGAGVEKLSVEGDRGALHIEVKYPNRANNTEPTVQVVQVPLQADLVISTVSANIDVHGVAPRELSLESVSGDIVANGAPRRAAVESVSGDVVLTFNSGDVEASAVSGDLTLNGRLNGEVSVETVSGNMRVDSRGERLRRLSASTVSGDAELKAALAPDGEISMESVSGDLTLIAPRDLSAKVSGESFSGDLNAPGAKIEPRNSVPAPASIPATARARARCGSRRSPATRRCGCSKAARRFPHRKHEGRIDDAAFRLQRSGSRVRRGLQVLLVAHVGHRAFVVRVGGGERVLAAGDHVVGADAELAAPRRAPGQA